MKLGGIPATFGAMAVRRTDAWPTVTHVCVDGALATVRFRGVARDGVERGCPVCLTIFRYVKPKPRGGYRPPPTGPGVSHF